MRISYWSSDVCSSDLLSMTVCLSEPGDYQGGELVLDSDLKFAPRFKMPAGSALLYATSPIHRVEPVTAGERLVAINWITSRIAAPFTRQINTRSEEHTSELQSPMRRSHAVYCLKKQQQEITS